VRVGSAVSNVDTFFVVNPQHLGGAFGSLTGGGILGSGGIYGRRSKRGVLVVDSLVLSGGVYRVDTVDTDPLAPGNQGFLPVTILSRGPVRIDSTATLSLSAGDESEPSFAATAAPGGGGGGSGGEVGGGSGFTGGGGAGRYDEGAITGATDGSGGSISGLLVAGPALSGVPGGATFYDASAGGGTGHPFGASGSFGQVSVYTPVTSSSGASGAGSGGSKALYNEDLSVGGGGAANATFGMPGSTTGEGHNGGEPVGCRQLVPLAGGSGGGGGGYALSGFANGGGGGGALALLSYGDMIVGGKISADGANGMNSPAIFHGSGGGGGAGGGILLGAKGTISFGPHGAVSATGGNGGKGGRGNLNGRDGGAGSDGRIRIDGRSLSGAIGSTAPFPAYVGPATGSSTLFPAQQGTVVQGFGIPGSTVRVFTRPENGAWSYGAPKDAVVGNDSTWKVTLGAEAASGMLYIAAMQRVDKPSRSTFTFEPDWIMSSAGGNVLGRPGVGIAIDSIAYPCIRFDSCATGDLMITNTGKFSDLQISRMRIIGADRGAFDIASPQFSVAAGTTRGLRVTFCPKDTGTFSAVLVLPTNVASPDSVKYVNLTGCALTGKLALPSVTAQPQLEIDLGGICVGHCRDTLVTLRNTGKAPLTVTQISGENSDITVQPLNRTLPITVGVGDSIALNLQICVRRFDPLGMKVVFRSTTIDSLTTLVVRGVNIGPNPGMVAKVEFGEIDLSGRDSCAEQVLMIRNLSPQVPLKLTSILPDVPQFTLLDPIADSVIAPGATLTLHLRFCTDFPGVYIGHLLLGFGGDQCPLDTAVTLVGHATQQRTQLVVLQPTSRSIVFPPALVNVATPDTLITIKNIGSTPGEIISPRVIVFGTTNVAEVLLDSMGRTFPQQIVPGSTAGIRARIRPMTLGDKEAAIVFSNGIGWSDTVRLFGRGVEAGIQVSLSRIDFDSTRVGRLSQERELTVYNLGDAPVTFNGLELPASSSFVITDTSRTLPNTLQPGGIDIVRLHIAFKPGAEGSVSETLRVLSNSSQQQGVIVTGRGVLEHVASDRESIDFGCIAPQKDSIGTFMLRNTGTWPLVVNGLPVLQGSGTFKVIGGKFPDTIGVGEAHPYAVRYHAGSAGSGPFDGTLQVKSSAPEVLTIDLKGSVCNDVGTATVSVADASYRLGSYFSLPISASFDPPLRDSTSYTLTLAYAYDLLVPLVSPRTDARPPEIDGTISSRAEMSEKPAGVLTVTGTIDPARSGELLVRIPMKVLLGSTYRTDLTIRSFTLGTPNYKVAASGGTFLALDCDTLGSIVIDGSYALEQNAPNPFNKTTVINYQTADRNRVQLNLYDAMGTFIRTLVNEIQDKGFHTYHLDATTLPSGYYIYELVSGDFRKSYQMVINK
jgi:hypothetical protein